MSVSRVQYTTQFFQFRNQETHTSMATWLSMVAQMDSIRTSNKTQNYSPERINSPEQLKEGTDDQSSDFLCLLKDHSSLVAPQKCPSHEIVGVLHGRGTWNVHLELYIPSPALILMTCVILGKSDPFKPQLPQLSIEKNHQNFLIDLFWAWDKIPLLKAPGIASGPSTCPPSFAASWMLCHCTLIGRGEIRVTGSYSCYLCFFPTS